MVNVKNIFVSSIFAVAVAAQLDSNNAVSSFVISDGIVDSDALKNFASNLSEALKSAKSQERNKFSTISFASDASVQIQEAFSKGDSYLSAAYASATALAGTRKTLDASVSRQIESVMSVGMAQAFSNIDLAFSIASTAAQGTGTGSPSSNVSSGSRPSSVSGSTQSTLSSASAAQTSSTHASTSSHANGAVDSNSNMYIMAAGLSALFALLGISL